MIDKELNQKQAQLRRQVEERYIELAGIDLKQALSLEKEIDAQYEALAAGVLSMLKQAGKETAGYHEDRLIYMRRRRRRLAVIGPAYRSILEMQSRRFPWWDPCTGDARFFSHGDPVTEPGMVSYEAEGNIAHLLVDTVPADSPKAVEAEFRFILDDPGMAGRYCVCPVVQMNGHWLAWAWNGGCGGGGSVGSSRARVTLQVKVYQGGLLKGETEDYPVVDEAVTQSMDHQSGFYYDSEIQGGANLTVELEPGTDATVVVKCLADVEVVNHGRAWVDLLTSPYFYFKVPEVHWGLSPWQVMEAVPEFPRERHWGRYRG